MSTIVKLGDQLLTGTDAFGCRWRTFDPITGWDGAPGTTLNPIQKPRAHGSWRGARPYLTPRNIELTGIVRAPDSDGLEAAIDRLNAAASLAGATLEITRGSSPRRATVDPDGEVDPQWVTDRIAEWTVPLTALDPRKYGDPLVLSTGLPSSTGGLTWPVTWPLEWDGATVTGIVSIDNPGNIESPVVLRIDGPVTGPRVRHVASGSELVLASDLVIADGSWLDINMDDRTVLEAGTASRNGSLTSRGWFALDPGVNEIVFSADVFDAAALLTITVAPAYK